jgi:nickel-dependent lactate racemase
VVRIPEGNLLWVEGPRPAPEVPDLGAAVTEAMRRPIGSPPLADLVRQYGNRTLVLADDNTRSTPQRAIHRRCWTS